MYDVYNEIREAFSLDWNNWIRFSSDNTNFMIGKRENEKSKR